MITLQPRICSAMELAIQAGLPSQSLITRPFGAQFRAVLDPLLQGAFAAIPLVLSFRDVEFMDSSFPDEVFGVIASERAKRNRPRACLAIRDVNSESFDNLEIALRSRPEREPGLRNCVLPGFTDQTRVELVGKAEANVEATFALLRAQRELTARDLADSLELNIAAASTRLKILFDLGLAARLDGRDAHGKIFTYRWPW